MGFIRFLLACGVVLGHSSGIFGYSPLGGDIAVQCFYIISGFYMALILNEKYTGPRSNFLFYTNRALKIYPLYWANLILMIGWATLTYKLGYPSTISFYAMVWPMPVATLIYFVVMNIFIFGADAVFILGIDKNSSLFFTSRFNDAKPNVYNFPFNGVAWTIGVELLFYLLAPFIARRTIWLAVAILLFSVGLRVLLAFVFYDGPPWSYMFFPTQLCFFMGGIIAYHIYKKLPALKLSRNVMYGMYAWLTLTVLAGYGVYMHNYPMQIALFLSFVLFTPVVFTLTKKSKIDRMLGDLSYPVYISQTIVLKVVLNKRFPIVISKGFTVLVMVIALAFVLDWLITRPIEKYRQNRVSQLSTADNSVI